MDTNLFIDITAEEEEEEEGEGSDCRPEVIGPSGKRTFQNKVDAIIDQFSRREEVLPFNSPPRRSKISHGIPVPRLNPIFIVDFHSGEFLNFMTITSFSYIIIQATAGAFALEYLMSKGFEAMTLPWLPRRLYVSASSPLEVRQNLPPSHRQGPKAITLLPPEEGTSLTTFKARKALPTQSWIRIKKSALYKGDLGYM